MMNVDSFFTHFLQESIDNGMPVGKKRKGNEGKEREREFNAAHEVI